MTFATRFSKVVQDDFFDGCYEDLDWGLKRQADGLKGLPLAMKKYIQAQRVITECIGHEHSPLTVAVHPQRLYQLMRNRKLVWDTKKRLWRRSLRGRRT